MKYSSEWCIGGVDINAVKLSMRMYIYRKHKFRDTIANVSTQHSKYNVSIFSIDRKVIYKYRYVYTVFFGLSNIHNFGNCSSL